MQSADTFVEHLPNDLKPLFELSDDLIFQLDLSWKIKTINKNGSAVLGFLPEEIIGKDFFDFTKSTYNTNIKNIFTKALNNNQPEFFEGVLYGKLKNEFNFRFRVKAIYYKDGKAEGIIGIGRNTSSIKKLEEKILELTVKLKEVKRFAALEKSRNSKDISTLEELNKMKVEFISNISHEFRTPLASIIGFSESISSDPAMTPEHQKEFNDIILSEGKKLAKFINDVLDMTRFEAGELELNKTNFNFSSLFKEVVESLSEEVQKKELHLSNELPDEDVFIYGDKEKLHQVFYSILDNSIKYTGRGGRVSLLLNVLYKEVEVIITDTGIGISQKKLPYIFQNYYYSVKFRDYDSKRNLGLVFVKYMVDLHKGSISIQSEVNEGTTVIVKLLKEE